MKKMNFICLCGCLLLLTHCQKPYMDAPQRAEQDWNKEKEFAFKDKEKDFTLKNMRFYNSSLPPDMIPFTFSFFFNKKRQLDSVVIDPSVVGAYTIFRRKDRIDSVIQTLFGSFSNGLPIQRRSGFDYDKHGNITRFTITTLGGFPAPPQTVGITYDDGNVERITQTTLSNPPSTTYYNFIYAGNNIARFTTVSPGSAPVAKRYTYDQSHLNPLYFIDDLLPVFALGSWWEFFLDSKNVSTTKYYEQSQQLVTFQNFYDKKGRLIKKIFTEPSRQNADSLTFEYVK